MSSEQGSYQLFRDGKVAFYFSGRWDVPNIEKTAVRWDIAPMPGGPARQVTVHGGTAIGTTSRSRNIPAAREFVRAYASRRTAASAMLAGRTVPIYRELAFGGEFTRLRPPASITRFAETMEAGAAQYFLYAPGGVEAQGMFYGRVEQAVTSPGTSIDEVLAGRRATSNAGLRRTPRRKRGRGTPPSSRPRLFPDSPMSRAPGQRKETLAALGFILPNLLGFLCFTAWPVVASLLLSFASWDLLTPPRWVGLGNYTALLGFHHAPEGLVANDPNFWKCMGDTFFMMLSIPLNMAGSLALDVLLNRKLRFTYLYRLIFFLPSILAGVAIFYLWRWMYKPDSGLLNALLARVGIAGPRWLAGPTWAKPALMLMGLWMGVGGTSMLLYLAALQGVSLELYEAADIDGCSYWRIFLQIILPLALPGLATLTIFTFMGVWGSFLWPLVVTNHEYLRTLPVGLQAFQGQYGTEWHLMMTASLLMLLPILGLLLLGQRFFISGLTVGAVRG